MRIFQAISIFFKVLFDAGFAARVQQLASGQELPAAAQKATAPKPVSVPAKPKPPTRNDAITLLATLQREARFVDIVMEPLGDYSDAQVGAATRDVLRDCGKTLERLFNICPVIDAAEGASHDTPATVDTAKSVV